MNKTLLAFLTLGFLAVIAVPNGNAMSDPPLTECYNYQWDSDHDGSYEQWHTCSTPPCGCYCPGAGVIVELTAAGQDKSVLVFASCNSGYGTGNEPSNNPESFGATVTPIVQPAGLGQVIDDVEYTVSTIIDLP